MENLEYLKDTIIRAIKWNLPQVTIVEGTETLINVYFPNQAGQAELLQIAIVPRREFKYSL